MKKAPEITLTAQDGLTLTRWSRGRSTPVRLMQRAKLVLLAAEGKMNKDIADELGINPNTVVRWRSRFAHRGVAGIEKDAPRGGRKPVVRNRVARRILEKTTQERPAHATHWSTRTLAAELKVSRSMVHRVWRVPNLQPPPTPTFKSHHGSTVGGRV